MKSLLLKAIKSFLKNIFEFDDIELNNMYNNVPFKNDAFTQFHVPFLIYQSITSGFSLQLTENKIDITLNDVDLKLNSVNNYDEFGEKKSLFEQINVFKYFIKNYTLNVTATNLKISANLSLVINIGELKIEANGLNRKEFKIKKISIFDNGIPVINDFELIFNMDDNGVLNLDVENIVLKMLPNMGSWKSLFTTLFNNHEVNETKNIKIDNLNEEEKNIFDMIIQSNNREEVLKYNLKMHRILIYLGKLKITFNDLVCSNKIKSIKQISFLIDDLEMKFKDFLIENDMFSIKSFNSQYIKQTNSTQEFLTSRLSKIPIHFNIAPLQFEGDLYECFRILNIINNFSTNLLSNFKSDNMITINFSKLKMIFNKFETELTLGIIISTKFQIIGSDIIVYRHNEINDPIFKNLSFQYITENGKKTLHISPTFSKFTIEDFQLFDEIHKHFLDQFFENLTSFNVAIISSNILFCKYYKGKKYHLFTISFSNILLNFEKENNKLICKSSINYHVKYLNHKTSNYDYLINPNLVETKIKLSERDTRFKFYSQAQVSVNITQEFLFSLIGEPVDECEIFLENRLEKDIKLEFEGQKIILFSKEKKSVFINLNSKICFPDYSMELKVNQIIRPISISKDLIVDVTCENNHKNICFCTKYEIYNNTSHVIEIFVLNPDKTTLFLMKPNDFISLESLDVNIYLTTNSEIEPKNKPFSLKKLPPIYFTNGCLLRFSSKTISKTNKVFINPLYFVKNDLPFDIVCKFFSDKTTSEEISFQSYSKKMFDFSENTTNISVTIFIPMLNEKITIGFNRFQQTIKLSQFIIEFNKTKNDQYKFKFYLRTIIQNVLPVPIYVKSKNKIFELSKDSTNVSLLNNLPTLFSKSKKMFWISSSQEGPFKPLTPFIDGVTIRLNSNIYTHIHISATKILPKTISYSLKPKLTITNKLSFDMFFFAKDEKFVVESNETKQIFETNSNFIYSVSKEDCTPFNDICLGFPIKTTFHITNDLDEFIICLNVEEHEGELHAYLIDSVFPSSFVITNQLDDFPIFVQQSEMFMPLRIFPNSTSIFSFDSLTSEPAVMLTIAGKSTLIPLHHEIHSSLLPFKLSTRNINVDLVILSKGILALVVGYSPFILPKKKISFSISLSDIRISFFDYNFEEFLLFTFKGLTFSDKNESIKLSFDSLQIDDQVSQIQNSVILKGTKQKENPFFQSIICYNSNIINCQYFNLLVQPIDIQLNESLLSDIISYFLPIIKLIDLNRFKQLKEYILILQQFQIHPILIFLNYNNTPNRPFSFNPLYKISHQLKSSTIAIGSFMCNDMNLTFGSLYYFLSKHFQYYFNLGGSLLNNFDQFQVQVITLPRFQASFIASEFYPPMNINFHGLEKREDTLYLSKIEVFPILSNSQSMSIKYSPENFLTYWNDDPQNESRLGNKIQNQRVYPSKIITLFTDEQTYLFDTLRKNSRKTGEILFLEYCNQDKIIAITNSEGFIFDTHTFKLYDNFLVNDIKEINITEKNVELIICISKRWTKKKEINYSFDFCSCEISNAFCILLHSLLLAIN